MKRPIRRTILLFILFVVIVVFQQFAIEGRSTVGGKIAPSWGSSLQR